jgi:hypothetical protein
VSTGSGHEERDVSLRPVVIAGLALAAVIVVTPVFMRWLQDGLVAHEVAESPPPNPLAATYGRETPPPPRLQVNPRSDLAALHAREDARLDHYGWIDRQGGRVHIPVARALDLMVAEGHR